MVLVATDLGTQAVELAASAGLFLDDWQERILRASLERDEEGHWVNFEVCAIVARQNGKGSAIEAREIVGLFLDPHCKLIIHTSHNFSTSREAMRRLVSFIDESPALQSQVKHHGIRWASGNESIELKDGSRINFKTRTKTGGRGLVADLLILDEAMILPEEVVGSLIPTLSAREHSQVHYYGSAVDQEIHEHGVVLSRLRERGQKGEPDLAFFEFQADAELSDVLADPKLLEDRELWRQANPALGVRISEDHVAKELQTMSARTFAVERLSLGDWPVTTPTAASLIAKDLWASLTDTESTIAGPSIFAFDVKPDRGKACISVSGLRADGLRHVEVIDHKDGVDWVADTLAKIAKAHPDAVIRCDSIGAAASLIPEIEALGVVKVQTVTGSEYGQACGKFFDYVAQGKLRHLGTPELAAAVNGAATRPLGESWAWARKKSAIDITPLVSCTLASWGEPKAPFEMFGGF